MNLIIFALICILLLGVAMFVGARWSRKKSEEFQKTETAKLYRNPLDGKPILEQLKSKETWSRVKDGLSRHDPFSDKTKAIRHDVVGYLGKVPFAIVIIITFGFIALVMYISI